MRPIISVTEDIATMSWTDSRCNCSFWEFRVINQNGKRLWVALKLFKMNIKKYQWAHLILHLGQTNFFENPSLGKTRAHGKRLESFPWWPFHCRYVASQQPVCIIVKENLMELPANRFRKQRNQKFPCSFH